MSTFSNLKKYLEENRVKFEHFMHAEAFTAQEKAALSHTPGKQRAKSVILRGDEKLLMAVIPSHKKLDVEKAKTCMGAEKVRLAKEEEFVNLFTDCETGAMHIFGNLYDLPVFVDNSLKEAGDIYFTACTHHETAKVSFEDFKRLVNPTICDITLDQD